MWEVAREKCWAVFYLHLVLSSKSCSTQGTMQQQDKAHLCNNIKVFCWPEIIFAIHSGFFIGITVKIYAEASVKFNLTFVSTELYHNSVSVCMRYMTVFVCATVYKQDSVSHGEPEWKPFPLEILSVRLLLSCLLWSLFSFLITQCKTVRVFISYLI